MSSPVPSISANPGPDESNGADAASLESAVDAMADTERMAGGAATLGGHCAIIAVYAMVQKPAVNRCAVAGALVAAGTAGLLECLYRRIWHRQKRIKTPNSWLDWVMGGAAFLVGSDMAAPARPAVFFMRPKI